MEKKSISLIGLLLICQLLMSGLTMAENKIGYRAFPPVINHPSRSELVKKSEFDRTTKQKLEEAPSVCAGHKRTIIWYAHEENYIVQVQFDSKPDVFARSLCTFTPTMGMDQIDSEFAQDVEAYILKKELGCQSDRLDIFAGKELVEVREYLAARGYTAK